MKRRAIILSLTILGVSLAIGLLPALAQPSFDFMPDGGQSMLRKLFSQAPAKVYEIAGATHTEAEWTAYLHEQAADLNDRERETLAGYLAVNMPLQESALKDAERKNDVMSAFPADGRQLAIDNCQFCHAFFSGYLMHDRDVEGWRSTFKFPFHKEIRMTDKEKETFARYSAVNMPLRIEDVPEELRF